MDGKRVTLWRAVWKAHSSPAVKERPTPDKGAAESRAAEIERRYGGPPQGIRSWVEEAVYTDDLPTAT